jgi:hypothetical protein
MLSHVFDGSRIRGKYWQVLINGTQRSIALTVTSTTTDACIGTHNKGSKSNEWTKYYHTALEAKLVLNNNIVVSLCVAPEPKSPTTAGLVCPHYAEYNGHTEEDDNMIIT